jgi:polysaccharide export outer membrane protein
LQEELERIEGVTMIRNRPPLGAISAVELMLLLVLVSQVAKAQTADSQEQGSLATAGAPSGDYRIGAGDSIQITVWREPEISAGVVVRPDGKISLPLINELYVTGKTPMEIQAVITEKLAPFVKDPNVTVTVREIRSRKVYILGEVGRPGSYQILQPTTILQLLTDAGGLQPYAKSKSIYLMRVVNGQQQKFPFNYKEVVSGKKIEHNILVEPGDTIVVP